MNDGRRTSRRLRTTMSAHHVVLPSISSSVCLSPSFWLYSDFPSSLSCFFSSSVVISHPSFSSSLYVPFSPLSVTPFLTPLCFYSCLFAALHLFMRLLLLLLKFMHSAQIVFKHIVCLILKQNPDDLSPEILLEHL